MISLKVLSTAAAMALVLPIVMPSASFAQGQIRSGVQRGAANAHPGGGGMRPGGGGGPHFSGGGGGGGGYHGGGGYRRGGGGGGFIPGLAAGAIIGGAIASQGYGPGYYAAPGPAYDEGYDDGPVAVVPVPSGGDDVAYCMQTYRSYDPRSGTYMGNDGYRHPCP
jgi:BA14K-like protein